MSDYYNIDRDADEVAAKFGCVAIRPKADEIQLDLDTIDHYNRAKSLLSWLLVEGCPMFYGHVKEWWKSKSGHFHVVVRFSKSFTDTERIALQAIFGSDPKREAINLARVLEGGHKDPIVLFRPKNAKIETGRLP